MMRFIQLGTTALIGCAFVLDLCGHGYDWKVATWLFIAAWICGLVDRRYL
jgi:hypothetical protein